MTLVDKNGDFLEGASSYKLNLPKDIPAHLFRSVTVCDSVSGSSLASGQPFPSINTMDMAAVNAEGSTDIYFGPNSPGDGKNCCAQWPQGFFAILRIYGPTKSLFDKT